MKARQAFICGICAAALVFAFTACRNSSSPSTKYYTVTFDSDGGHAVAAQSVAEGKTATKPADPVKDNNVPGLYTQPDYLFIEWQKDDGTAWDFNADTVTGNVTLKATWEEPSAPIDVSAQDITVENVEQRRDVINDVARAIDYVNESSGTYTLLVGEDVFLQSQTLSSGVESKNLNLTIIGVGGEERQLKFVRVSNGVLFQVGPAVNTWQNSRLYFNSLTIGNNITLVGLTTGGGDLVRVSRGNSFTMLEGSKITGNTPSNSSGVVTVQGQQQSGNNPRIPATFTMKGGLITGNSTNGGTFVQVTNGVFIMEGGSISGNAGGAGLNVQVGNFTMTGGSISDNGGDYDARYQTDDRNFLAVDLSGDATIGRFYLAGTGGDTVPRPYIRVTPGWTGGVERLSLQRLYTAPTMPETIDFWHKTASPLVPILLSSDNTINISDAIIERITLGDFVATIWSPMSSTRQRMTGNPPGAGNYYLYPQDIVDPLGFDAVTGLGTFKGAVLDKK